uniref:Uncharacterized protein n=1 Tax=Rhizophora mucronata TaxID=61149 RepID=A0A2P2QBQ0_RHIMU
MTRTKIRLLNVMPYPVLCLCFDLMILPYIMKRLV